MVLSEKVVGRMMREENLIDKSIKMRKYNFDHGELSPALPNILQRDFKVDKPNEKWVTDITEFSIPAGKVYLSPIVAVVSWTINTSPNAELVNTMLDQAVFILQKDEQPFVHIDRGVHYQWQGWINRMDNHHLIRLRKLVLPIMSHA